MQAHACLEGISPFTTALMEAFVHTTELELSLSLNVAIAYSTSLLHQVQCQRHHERNLLEHHQRQQLCPGLWRIVGSFESRSLRVYNISLDQRTNQVTTVNENKQLRRLPEGLP